MEVSSFRSRLRSSRVVPGLAATWARMRSPSRWASDARLLARDFGSIDGRPSCEVALMDRTQAALMPSTSAISLVVMPSLGQGDDAVAELDGKRFHRGTSLVRRRPIADPCKTAQE